MSHSILSRGITVEQLIVFTRVIETGSLMSAAGNEKSRQSSYSRRLKSLEEALEKKLFIRAGRRLVLTEDGRRFAVMVNSFFASVDEFAFGPSSQVLRVGAGESVMEALVYPNFKILREAMQEICFEFVSLSTEKTVSAMRTGQIELGIVRRDADLTGCAVRPLRDMEFELVIPRRHLPQGDVAALGQTKDLPIATLSGQGQFVRALLNLMTKEGLEFRIAARADSFMKVAQLARNAGLAAFVPTDLAAGFPQDEFTRYRTEAFNALSRSFVLATAESAMRLRPALQRSFEQVARILAG